MSVQATTTVDAVAVRSRPMSREEKRVILASSLGTVFEWYDFYLYGSLAAIIGAQFFSQYPEATRNVFALLAFDPDVAAETTQDLAADRQAEAGPLRLVGERIAGLLEALEDPLLVLPGDAAAVVGHVEAQELCLAPCVQPDPAVALRAELHGIGH